MRPAATLAILVEANTSKAARSLRTLEGTLGHASTAASKATANTSKYGQAATSAGAATGKLATNTSKLTSPLSRVGRSASTAAKQTDRLHRSSTSLGTSLKGAAKGAVALAAAYVGTNTLTGAITDTIDLGKATDRLSTLTGLSVKTASEWIETAKVRKIQSTQLNMGFITLAKNIKAATEASGTQRDLFNQLGISMEDLKRKNFQKTLLEIADKVEALGPGFQRASIVSKLFGRSAQSLAVLLASGSAGIREQLALVEKHGAALDKNEIEKTKAAAKAQRELALAFDGLKKKVSLALFDAGVSIKRFMDRFPVMKISFLDVTRAVKRFVASLPGIDISLLDVLRSIRKFISKIPGINVSLLDVLRSARKMWAGLKSTFSDGVTAVLGSVKGMGRGIVSVAKGIISTFVSIGSAIRSVAQWIVRAVRRIVGAFGDLKNKLPDAGSLIPDLPSVNIGPVHFQRGGPIDLGKPSGDSVPALLERGEYVLNRNATKKIGKRNLDAVNFDNAPRFAKGGGIPAIRIGGSGASQAIVQGATDVMRGAANAFIKTQRPKGGVGGSMPGTGGEVPGHPELQPGISSIVNAVLKRFPGLAITSTTGGGHATNSLHYSGRAADLAASSGYMLKAAGWIGPTMGRALTEGIHNPNLSVAGGHGVPASYWGAATWADHLDHIHLGKQRGGAIGRGLRRFQKGGPVDWRKIFGSSFSADEMATLAYWAGAKSPGLMAQIGMGESSGNPFAVGDGGDSIGLWQIDTAFHPQYSKSWLRNPLHNAKAMAAIQRSEGIGAWHASPTGAKGRVIPRLLAALRGKGGGAAGGGGGGPSFTPHAALGGQMFAGPGGAFPVKGTQQGVGSAGPVTLPGLGPTSLIPGGAALPGWAQRLLKMPGLNYEGKLGILENVISAAGETPGTGDDLAALTAKMGLLTGNKGRLLKKLAAISKKLRQPGLTPKQRKALLAQQATVLSNLGSTMGEIGSTRSAIQGLKDPSLTEETAQALAESLQRMNELLAQQVANQQAFYNVSQSQYGVLAQAIAAVASGQIGGSVGLGFSAPSTPGTLASY